VLDRIGDESVFPCDAGIVECGIENAASRSDERLARQVLLVAGLFADQHEIGLFWTFARHRLRSIAIERTSPACASCQRAQRLDGFAASLVHLPIHGGRMPSRGKRSKARV